MLSAINNRNIYIYTQLVNMLSYKKSYDLCQSFRRRKNKPTLDVANNKLQWKSSLGELALLSTASSGQRRGDFGPTATFPACFLCRDCMEHDHSSGTQTCSLGRPRGEEKEGEKNPKQNTFLKTVFSIPLKELLCAQSFLRTDCP